MAANLIKLRITRPVIVDGKPAKVGDVVSVDHETAVAIKRASELFTSKPAETAPETVEHADPEPETREPKSFFSKKR